MGALQSRERNSLAVDAGNAVPRTNIKVRTATNVGYRTCTLTQNRAASPAVCATLSGSCQPTTALVAIGACEMGRIRQLELPARAPGKPARVCAARRRT